jgi:Fe(3+) dicitrate transport protein
MGHRHQARAALTLGLVAVPVRAEPGVPEPGAPEPGAPEAPLEVTVQGSAPARAGGSVHVLDAKKLERFEYDDPERVLLSVPGVFLRGEDGYGLRPNVGIRGASSDRSKKLTLMEDGVPFAPAPYSAPAAYYFPLVTRMQSVRVVKGPAAIPYGPQTIGGAIDLRTRPIPGTGAGAIDVAGGEHGYAKVHAHHGLSDERSGLLLEGVHLESGGFKQLDGGGDTGFLRNEWMAKGRLVLDPRAAIENEIGVKVGWSDELSNETYLGLTDADFRATPYRRYRASALDRMRWHRTQIVVSHVVSFDPRVQLRTDVYRHDLSRTWRKLNRFAGADLADVLADPSGARRIYYDVLTGAQDSASPDETLLVGPNDRSFVSEGIQTVARVTLPGRAVSQRLEYGVRLHRDSVERHHSEDGFVMRSGELVPTGAPTAVTADNDAETHAVALHVLDTLAVGRLTLSPGVRLELIRSRHRDRLDPAASSSGGYGVAVPGIGAHFALTRALGVLAGVHRGFSPLPPGQRPGSEPERSTSYEAGARFARGASRAELVGFFQDYSNLTDICTLSNGCLDAQLDRQYDAGRAQIWGAEAWADHTFRAGALRLPVSLAYTVTRSELLESFESDDPILGNVEAGDELPYVPRHQGQVTFGVEGERWGAVVSASYVDAMREQAGRGEPPAGGATDAYLLLDAGARLRAVGRLELYANAQNLLDTAYVSSRRPFGARPGVDRWFNAGLRLGF